VGVSWLLGLLQPFKLLASCLTVALLSSDEWGRCAADGDWMLLWLCKACLSISAATKTQREKDVGCFRQGIVIKLRNLNAKCTECTECCCFTEGWQMYCTEYNAAAQCLLQVSSDITA
jgi:hypothetical protein